MSKKEKNIFGNMLCELLLHNKTGENQGTKIGIRRGRLAIFGQGYKNN